MLSMMSTSEQVGFSLVLGVGRIDNNNYMDIYTTIRDARDSFMIDFVNLLEIDAAYFNMQCALKMRKMYVIA